MKRLALAALVAVAPTFLAAETELSFYLGFQESPHSQVDGTDPGNAVDPNLDFTAGWEGLSFEMPPYYGARATFWRTETFGWGAEFTHTKVYGDAATLADNGFTRFELTDGLNIITVNAMRRWPNQWGSVTPYVGGGLGIAVPHVDIESAGGKAFGYQLTGPAVRWTAGASYDINDQWAVFGEYQGTYSMNRIDLGSGGSLETDIITNAVNLGVSFSF